MWGPYLADFSAYIMMQVQGDVSYADYEFSDDEQREPVHVAPATATITGPIATAAASINTDTSSPHSRPFSLMHALQHVRDLKMIIIEICILLNL